MEILIWVFVAIWILAAASNSKKKTEPQKKAPAQPERKMTSTEQALAKEKARRQLNELRRANGKQPVAASMAKMPEMPQAEGGAPIQEDLTELKPQVHVSKHTHGTGGSLGDNVSEEGEDPCHEDELAPEISPCEPQEDESAESAPGLTFNWTGDDLVRGFVMSEVLKRPCQR